MSERRQVLSWALLIAFAISSGFAHQRLSQDQAAADRPPVVPNVDVLRPLSLGHHTSLADLYWLKWVQYLGTSAAADQGWPQLYELILPVVGLDPLYGYAYQSAGLMLASANRYTTSNKLLEEGMLHVHDRWQLPFLAGINYWLGLGDMKQGGVLMLRASEIPGGPRYLPDLANRLFSSAGSIEDGLQLMELSLQSANDPLIKAELERRHEQLLAERALQTLEAAISDYRLANGSPPALLEDLNDLTVQGILQSSFASTITYVSSSGVVNSSLLPTRLVLYKPGTPGATSAP